MPSRYLIRIDDICPTMNWSVWNQVEEILSDAGVRPLLAIVPDNRDPDLVVDPPAADFWDRARAWQQRGWSIGLHGYQHAFTTRDAGLIGRNPYSEFAGVPLPQQRAKLQAASDLFRRHGVKPDAFVAPAHSFDAATLELLPEVGIDLVSDGYALGPFVKDGLIWVPVQIGRFYDLPFGDWTVCLHINRWTGKEIGKFGERIAALRPRITSLDALRAAARHRSPGLADRLFDAGMRTARRLKQ